MILAGCEVGEFEAGIVFAIAVNLQCGVLFVRGYHYLHFIILRVNLRIDFPDFVTQKTLILQLIDKQYFVSLRHLILGDAKGFLTMFIRKKRHRSGNIGVIVVEKIGGKMKELATIGVAYNEDEVENLVNEAKEWISKYYCPLNRKVVRPTP